MKIVIAGQGAFGQKHLEGIQNIAGIEVVSLAGGSPDSTREVAQKFKVPHWTSNYSEALKQPGVEAVILATPTQMHARQGIEAMRAGKHVQIEIPMADSLKDAEELVRVQKETGLVAMAGHTRRFNPSHQWVKKRIKAGELAIQQMNITTYFFRRTNMNAAGKPRSWTDHLLWHHACHTVDLFMYQTGEPVSDCYAIEGRYHPQRYICDNGTYVASYDDLNDGDGKKVDVSKVDVSMNGIELQDREFFAAIKEKREPNASVAQALPAMQVLDRLEKILARSK
jgi:2-hydroxy-4-carboxymuconate semialdehyde hemiacetal dehydrogenase